MPATLERKIRKGQILSFDEMKENFVYISENDNYGPIFTFRLLSKKLTKSNHGLSDKMKTGTSWFSESDMYLGDDGLQAYNNGRWNDVNYIRLPTVNELFEFIKKESRSMSKYYKKLATP